MAKQTTSFRLPEDSINQLNVLTEIFRESGAEVVERAILLLYNSRESEAKRDLEERLKGVTNKS